MRMRAAKEIATASSLTPRGPMTAEARARVIEESRASWATMSQDDKAMYQDMYKNRMEERRSAVRDAAGQQEGDVAQDEGAIFPSSPWGCGGRSMTVHPSLIQKAFAQGQRIPTINQVYEEGAHIVSESERADLVGEDVQIDGCLVQGRNLCPLDPLFRQADALARAIAKIVDRIGATQANLGDSLFMLEGRGVQELGARDGHFVMWFVLLSCASFSPKFQDFTWCDITSPTSLPEGEVAFPIDVRLGTTSTALTLPGAPPTRCLAHLTSDTLCKRMAQTARCWRIVVVDYDMLSTMHMQVTGLSPDVRMRASVEGTHVHASGVDGADALDRELLVAARLGSVSGPRRQPPRRPRLPQQGTSSVASHRSGASSALRTNTMEEGHNRGTLDDDDEALAGGPDINELASNLTSSQVDFELLALGAGEEPDADAEGEMDGAGIAESISGSADLLASEGGQATSVGGGAQAEAAGEQSATIMTPSSLAPPHVGSASSSSSTAALSPEVVTHEAVAEAADVVSGLVAEVVAATGLGGDAGNIAQASRDGVAPSLAQESVGDETLGVATASTDAMGNAIPGAPGWSMTERGYVFNPSKRFVGRITSWSKSVSAKCALHSGCAVAVSRAKWSDATLVKWLEKGLTDYPGADQKLQHKASWPPTV